MKQLRALLTEARELLEQLDNWSDLYYSHGIIPDYWDLDYAGGIQRSVKIGGKQYEVSCGIHDDDDHSYFTFCMPNTPGMGITLLFSHFPMRVVDVHHWDRPLSDRILNLISEIVT